jgi:energy-converting hydrogenase B subunit Q
MSICGKRVIVVGAGAQVGQVAIGAVGEPTGTASGEKISVDTIPIVGEENLAAAVLAVARLRARPVWCWPVR